MNEKSHKIAVYYTSSTSISTDDDINDNTSIGSIYTDIHSLLYQLDTYGFQSIVIENDVSKDDEMSFDANVIEKLVKRRKYKTHKLEIIDEGKLNLEIKDWMNQVKNQDSGLVENTTTTRTLTFYHGKINKNNEITVKSGKQSKTTINGLEIHVTQNKSRNGKVAGRIVFNENKPSQHFGINNLVGEKNTNGFVMKLSENSLFGGIPFRIDKKSFKRAVEEEKPEYLIFSSHFITQKRNMQYFFKFKKFVCSNDEKSISNEDNNGSIETYTYQRRGKDTFECDYNLDEIYFNMM